MDPTSNQIQDAVTTPTVAPPVDMGDWLRQRAAARGDVAPRIEITPDRFWTPDVTIGAVAGVFFAVSLAGRIGFMPYDPVRVALLVAGGLLAAVVGFVGLYILGFQLLRLVPHRVRWSAPLLIVSLVLGGLNVGVEMSDRAHEANEEAAGKVSKVREYARRRGWLQNRF